ncbi:MAG: hypothetical protein IT369_10715 [Candidatus Latescibacteria bacterium]|nr:hypothetical protein [Candidatus Latescibacterota bacterium]
MLVAGISVFLASKALAHCDTTKGPIIPEARAALEKGVVTPVLKWVKPETEAEIRAAFSKAVAVRAQGPEAKALADQYFLETLVRVHRAGEGAPYSGIKDEPVEPIVSLADQALSQGAIDGLVEELSDHLGAALRERFSKAVEASKHKDTNVEAGRAFVEAYVDYMHYVEGLHTAIVSPGSHPHAEEAEQAAPAHQGH